MVATPLDVPGAQVRQLHLILLSTIVRLHLFGHEEPVPQCGVEESVRSDALLVGKASQY